MTRVLLVRLSAMGDIVQSLGAVQALAHARPDLELHFVAQRPFVPLLDGLEHIASVIPHDRRGLRGYLDTAERLRRLAPAVAIDLQGNWKSAGLCRLSGARERIGAAGGLRREWGSQILLNRLVSDAPNSHPARLALAAVRALAPGAAAEAPRLVATADELERAAVVLRGLGLSPTDPFRVVVFGPEGDPRSWPVAAAHRQIALDGRPAVWVGGPAEVGVALPKGARALRYGPGELRRLCALGVLCAAAGGDVIGPDLGATHVLAACGAASRVMFGSNDPGLTAPPAAEVHRRADGPSCVPCRRRVCRHPQGPVCMDFTTAEARGSPPMLPGGAGGAGGGPGAQRDPAKG